MLTDEPQFRTTSLPRRSPWCLGGLHRSLCEVHALGYKKMHLHINNMIGVPVVQQYNNGTS